MTVPADALTMRGMKKFILIGAILGLALSAGAQQKNSNDSDEEEMSNLSFVVLKDYNGKPVRNAGIVMHPVGKNDKQENGGIELKSDLEGKASFDGVPYGKLRVQVLATGFQTYGEDFDIEQPTVAITVRLKRPSGQYSIYENHAGETDKSSGKEKPPDTPPPHN